MRHDQILRALPPAWRDFAMRHYHTWKDAAQPAPSLQFGQRPPPLPAGRPAQESHFYLVYPAPDAPLGVEVRHGQNPGQDNTYPLTDQPYLAFNVQMLNQAQDVMRTLMQPKRAGSGGLDDYFDALAKIAGVDDYEWPDDWLIAKEIAYADILRYLLKEQPLTLTATYFDGDEEVTVDDVGKAVIAAGAATERNEYAQPDVEVRIEPWGLIFDVVPVLDGTGRATATLRNLGDIDGIEFLEPRTPSKISTRATGVAGAGSTRHHTPDHLLLPAVQIDAILQGYVRGFLPDHIETRHDAPYDIVDRLSASRSPISPALMRAATDHALANIADPIPDVLKGIKTEMADRATRPLQAIGRAAGLPRLAADVLVATRGYRE